MNHKDLWQHTPSRMPEEPVEGSRSRSAALTARILYWSLPAVVLGLLAWAAADAVRDHMEAPEKERRIQACTAAMEHVEAPRGPLEPCEDLSASERREASYRFARDRELF